MKMNRIFFKSISVLVSILFTVNSVSYGAIDFSLKLENKKNTLRAAAAAAGQAGVDIAAKLEGTKPADNSARSGGGGYWEPLDTDGSGLSLTYPYRDTSTPRAFADFKSSSAGRVISTDKIRIEIGKDIAVPTISVSFGNIKITADKEAPMNSIGAVTERVSKAGITIHRKGDRKGEYAKVFLVETTRGILYPMLAIGTDEAASASGIIKGLTPVKIAKILKMANLGPRSLCCREWMEYVGQRFPNSVIYKRWLKATGQKGAKSSSSGEGTVEPFIYKGKYEAQKLTAKGGSFIKVIPALNGKVISLTAMIKGKPVETLYVLDDPDEPRGGITGLYFPWAGRLGKVFTYRGRRVDLSKYIGDKIRDDGRGNGLHGLLSFEPWEFLGTSFESDSAAIGLGYDAGENPIFKEMFGEGASASLYRGYTIEPNKLIIRNIVTNNGTEPFIFTTTEHTWFDVPDPATIDRERCQVLVPADRHYKTENGMPVGLEDAKGIYDLRALTALGKTNYDDTYTALRRDAEGNAVMYLVNPAQGTIIKTTQSKEYTHSVCFAPLARPNVSLEAQAGMADAFNHQGEEGSGLVELNPLETWQATFTIEVIELTEEALTEIAASASLAKSSPTGNVVELSVLASKTKISVLTDDERYAQLVKDGFDRKLGMLMEELKRIAPIRELIEGIATSKTLRELGLNIVSLTFYGFTFPYDDMPSGTYVLKLKDPDITLVILPESYIPALQENPDANKLGQGQIGIISDIKSSSSGDTITVGDITFDVEDVNAASLLAREFGPRAARHLIMGITRMKQEAKMVGRLALTEYNISTILRESAVCAYIFFTGHEDSCLIFVSNQDESPKIVPLLIRAKGERSIDVKLVTLTPEIIDRLRALPNLSPAAMGTLELLGASSQFVEKPAQYKQFKATAAILAAA